MEIYARVSINFFQKILKNFSIFLKKDEKKKSHIKGDTAFVFIRHFINLLSRKQRRQSRKALLYRD